MFIPIVAILSTIALPIALGSYIIIRSVVIKHKERMELIKQGIVPPEKSKPVPNKYRSLRNGILLVGIALGMIISLVISYQLELTEDESFWVVAPGVLFFLGLGYLIFYFLMRNKKDIDEEIE